jgi:hypothetical protein
LDVFVGYILDNGCIEFSGKISKRCHHGRKESRKHAGSITGKPDNKTPDSIGVRRSKKKLEINTHEVVIQEVKKVVYIRWVSSHQLLGP